MWLGFIIIGVALAASGLVFSALLSQEFGDRFDRAGEYLAATGYIVASLALISHGIDLIINN